MSVIARDKLTVKGYVLFKSQELKSLVRVALSHTPGRCPVSLSDFCQCQARQLMIAHFAPTDSLQKVAGELEFIQTTIKPSDSLSQPKCKMYPM